MDSFSYVIAPRSSSAERQVQGKGFFFLCGEGAVEGSRGRVRKSMIEKRNAAKTKCKTATIYDKWTFIFTTMVSRSLGRVFCAALCWNVSARRRLVNSYKLMSLVVVTAYRRALSTAIYGNEGKLKISEKNDVK